MKLTAPDAAFLHLASIAASDPRRLQASPELRRAISALSDAGLSCADPLMSQVRWSYMAMCKALEAAAPDGGIAFWNASQDFAHAVDAANFARANSIMTRHFAGAAP